MQTLEAVMNDFSSKSLMLNGYAEALNRDDPSWRQELRKAQTHYKFSYCTCVPCTFRSQVTFRDDWGDGESACVRGNKVDLHVTSIGEGLESHLDGERRDAIVLNGLLVTGEIPRAQLDTYLPVYVGQFGVRRCSQRLSADG